MAKHRVIVYQYGKVGSTSLVNALNKLRNVEAFQSHFLGKKAFNDTIERILTAGVSDYFFEHSLGQLVDNIKVHRHYVNRYHGVNDDPLTVLTACREPWDWFRSSITQDIQGHLESLSTMLDKRGRPGLDNDTLISEGLALVFDWLLSTIDYYGSLDGLCQGSRWPDLRENTEYVDVDDFRSLMFFLNVFLRPHVWFQHHLAKTFAVELQEFELMDYDAYRLTREWGNIYLLKYESMASAIDPVLQEVGITQQLKLKRSNVSARKSFVETIRAAFASPRALELKSKCSSEDTRYLGYT